MLMLMLVANARESLLNKDFSQRFVGFSGDSTLGDSEAAAAGPPRAPRKPSGYCTASSVHAVRPAAPGDNGGVSSDHGCGAVFHKNSPSSKVPWLTFNVGQSLAIRPSVMPAREPLVQWLTLVRAGVGGQFTGSHSLSSAVKLVQLSRTLWSPDAAPRCCRLTRLSRSCEVNNEINLPRQASQCPLQPC